MNHEHIIVETKVPSRVCDGSHQIKTPGFVSSGGRANMLTLAKLPREAAKDIELLKGESRMQFNRHGVVSARGTLYT